MKVWIWLVVLAIFANFGKRNLYALELQVNHIHQDYLSVRAMGMGNAFTAVADDFHSLFYNPAGLAHLPEWKLNILLAKAGVSVGDSSFSTLYDDLTAANKKVGDAKTLALAQAIEKLYGKNYYLRLSALNVIWAKQNWGIGFIPFDVTLNLGIRKNVGPTLNVSAHQDSTLAFGYARAVDQLLHGLTMGLTFKTVYRGYFASSIPAAELADNKKILRSSDAKEGMTFDADLGFLYRPFDGEFSFIDPGFGLVIRNMADYGFSQNLNLVDDQSGKAPRLQRRFDVGTRLKFRRFLGFRPLASLDIRDMGHENWTMMKGLHVGSELQWGWKWLNGGFRLGLSQGYYTAGFSLKGLWALFEAVSFGEEIGTKNAKKENRINMAKLSLDF